MLLLGICSHAIGQRVPSSPGSSTYPGAPSSSQQPEIPKEKAYVNYYTISEKDINRPFIDTSLSGFETYLPHREWERSAFNLGNPGSSAYRIEYQTRGNVFTDIGFNQYDIYRLELEDFRFFDLNRAYNDLYFSPQSGQQNFIAKAKFSRNLDDGINLAIDFERIKQEGFYTSQDSKMTRFGFGLSKRSKHHELYLIMIANNFNEVHNGGISDDINSDEYSHPDFRNQRTSINTFLEDANGRHQYFSYSMENIWKPANGNFTINNLTRIEHGYYRYSHEFKNSVYDSSVYINHLTDDRGIRMLNRFNRYANDLDLRFKHKSLDLSAGLDYKLLQYDNSVDSESFHDLAITGSLNFRPKKLGELNARTEIGIAENAGNFLLEALLRINITNAIQFTAGFETSRYDPYVFQRELYLSDQLAYSNSFSKINEAQLRGVLEFEKLNLLLAIRSGIIDNAISYDDTALPIQNDGSVEYIQAEIRHRFFWKFIGLENEVLYQNFYDNIYRLPELYSRHNLFLQARLFKKRLLGRLGVQYYNILYDGSLSYMPVTGIFYPDSSEREYFPISDVYMNFKVDKFRIFFRYDNFFDLIQKKVHSQITNHPQFDAKFRMGVRWIFSD